MICATCARQLAKPGRHRAHRGCLLNVIAGSVAGPCWCPVCHPIPTDFDPPPMAASLLLDLDTQETR